MQRSVRAQRADRLGSTGVDKGPTRRRTVRTVRNPLGPDWARKRVVDPGTNRFWSNRYSGSWRFDLRSPGQTLTGEAWRGTGQDAA